MPPPISSPPMRVGNPIAPGGYGMGDASSDNLGYLGDLATTATIGVQLSPDPSVLGAGGTVTVLIYVTLTGTHTNAAFNFTVVPDPYNDFPNMLTTPYANSEGHVWVNNNVGGHDYGQVTVTVTASGAVAGSAYMFEWDDAVNLGISGSGGYSVQINGGSSDQVPSWTVLDLGLNTNHGVGFAALTVT